MRKRSGQVLHVTFGAQQAGGVSALHQAADDLSSYALAADVLTGTMLEKHVEWANNNVAEGKEKPSVVHHECTMFDYNAFGVLFRILNRMYVTIEEVRDSKNLIDYYCPSFDYQTLLLDPAVAEKDGSSTSTDNEPKKSLTDVSDAAKKACAVQDAATKDAVIVCESDERTTIVAERAKQLGLPYVPFRFIFVEGVLQTRLEADMYLHKLPVMPAFLSLGDYDNIFMCRSLVHKGRQDMCGLEKLYQKHDIFNAVLKGEFDGPRRRPWHTTSTADAGNQEELSLIHI